MKQNKYTDRVEEVFIDLVNRYDSCILGCTELPILYKKYKLNVKCNKIIDPLFLGLLKLKEEYEDE